MASILYLIYVFGVPAALVLLARRWTWITKISPMVILYVIGLIAANLTPFMRIPEVNALNDLISNLMVPIAIPLMLMCNTISGWSTKRVTKLLLTALFSVMACTFAGFFIFKGDTDSRTFAQISAIATGLYTGGIPNIGAIALGVDISKENYLYVTSYDMVATFSYLLFLIFFGKRFFRWILPLRLSRHDMLRTSRAVPVSEITSHGHHRSAAVPITDEGPWRKGLRYIISHTWAELLFTLVIAAVSYAVSLLASSDGSPNMTVLILTLTTLSIAASYIPLIKRQEGGFDMGLYFVYVFCLALASACDIRTMDLLGSLSIFGLVAFIIFGSLLLQIILSKIFKIDGDHLMVASIALINSPPFVPMVAAIVDRKDIVPDGIAIGIVGYLLGNYLGIGTFMLLCNV